MFPIRYTFEYILGSSPLRSRELTPLQPWTKTGTTPLVSGPASPSTHELEMGLTKEVEHLPANQSGMKKAILAKRFSAISTDA